MTPQEKGEAMIKDRYLGDGVYAAWDGYHIWLDTRAQTPTGRIALEPSVLRELDKYRKHIEATLRAAREGKVEP